MANLVFELEDVSFSYLNKFPALQNINLDIREGERIAILGANGSGKSTLLNLLDALNFPDEGVIKFLGKELCEKTFNDENFTKDFRAKVGLVFQNPDVQLFSPTVKEDMLFGPLQLGFSKEKIQERLEKLLTLFNIGDLIDRAPHQLSVGEKKKVGIASVLAIEPEILLLDEPTAGLDPRTVRELIDIIEDYHNQGKTIITATHDLHIVSEIAEKIYILDDQKTVSICGSCEEILSNQELLLKYNLLHIHKHPHNGLWHKHPHQHAL